MKIVTYRVHDSPVLTGVVVAEQVLDVSDWIVHRKLSKDVIERQHAAGISPPTDGILRWLQSGENKIEALAAHVRECMQHSSTQLRSLDQVQLLAPVPRPGKIIGVGRNYADHAKEIGTASTVFPKLFFKPASAVVGPRAAVSRPRGVAKLDFEVELAVVIGNWGRDVPQSKALSLVAGYTVLNDLSAREYQFDFHPAQTSFAKAMDSFAPMGPWLVSSDEIPNPQTLRLSCHLNGRLMQEGHTKNMLFTVAYLVAYCSRFLTLEPGDVITTGTPAGVGAFRTPPVYLEPGDQLLLDIERVGAMEHRIVEPLH